MHEYLRVISADLPGEGRRAVISLSNDESGEGDVWSDLAAAGAAVIHGRAVVRREQGCLEEHDFDLTACPLAVRGGGVWRLDGVRPRKIPLMPPTSTVALAGDRVALVPEADGRSVEVRRLGSGTRVARADLDGNVSALAVSRAALVALVVDGRSRALAVLDPATARLRGTYPVAGSVRPILALAGDDLVYQVGRRLWRLDTTTGRRTVVVQLLREPVAFSLEGRRLAWVERRSGVWLVRTLDLNA